MLSCTIATKNEFIHQPSAIHRKENVPTAMCLKPTTLTNEFKMLAGRMVIFNEQPPKYRAPRNMEGPVDRLTPTWNTTVACLRLVAESVDSKKMTLAKGLCPVFAGWPNRFVHVADLRGLYMHFSRKCVGCTCIVCKKMWSWILDNEQLFSSTLMSNPISENQTMKYLVAYRSRGLEIPIPKILKI